MRFHRGTAACAVALVMVSGLAACGDEEPTEPFETKEPTSQSSSSGASGSRSSSSGSSSSGGTSSDDLPADLPEAAREETKEGAAAFGEYYQTAFGDAAASGDSAAIKEIRTDDCNACLAGEEQIDSDKKKGWVRSTNPYSITDVAATKRPDEGYKVSMRVKAKQHYRVDSSGEKNAMVKATSFNLTQHVVWAGDQWTMASWVAQAE